MKTYFVITGVIFGLLAVMHVMETAAVWGHLTSDPLFVLGRAAIAVAAGALSIWAWRLLRSVIRA